MSYDYSSAGATLELPNPYKVQNLLLFLSGGTLVVFGVLALLEGRITLAAIPLSIGMAFIRPMRMACLSTSSWRSPISDKP